MGSGHRPFKEGEEDSKVCRLALPSSSLLIATELFKSYFVPNLKPDPDNVTKLKPGRQLNTFLCYTLPTLRLGKSLSIRSMSDSSQPQANITPLLRHHPSSLWRPPCSPSLFARVSTLRPTGQVNNRQTSENLLRHAHSSKTVLKHACLYVKHPRPIRQLNRRPNIGGQPVVGQHHTRTLAQRPLAVLGLRPLGLDHGSVTPHGCRRIRYCLMLSRDDGEGDDAHPSTE